MTVTDVGELTIVVDETHEDVPCFGEDGEAVYWIRWRCGCVIAYCLQHYDIVRHHDSTPGDCYCYLHGLFAVPAIIRTWPVTR